MEDPAALDCILDEVQGRGAHRYEILLETFEGMGVWGSEYDELIVSESGQFVRHKVRRKFAPPEFDEARLLWGVVDPTRAQACRGLTDPQEALDCVRDIFEGGCEKVEELDCMLAP